MSQTFTYSFTAGGDTGTIVVTADDTATNSGSGLGYDITAISGEFDGKTITGEYGTAGPVAHDANGYTYDNVIFTDDNFGFKTSTFGIDAAGLDFTTADGDDYNIYAVGTNSFEFISDNTTAGKAILDSTNAACYFAGTRILTDEGEVAIEGLKIGDRLITRSGAARPVKWLGHRVIDGDRHPDPEAIWPIRVVAGAFGERRPSRDLWLSPRHAIFNEGALIQIRDLVNGRTIIQEKRGRIEYWHVELDAHDVIFAEGLAAETFLDNGNRADFVNGADFLRLHPDFKPVHWTDTCAPLCESGEPVERTKAALLAVAESLGYRDTPEPDLRIVADGARVEPIKLAGGRYAFALPPCAKDVFLESRSFVPAQAFANLGDRRRLGVCVHRLQIDGEAVSFDEALGLEAGWHAPEGERRWTDGRARLPEGARLVVVDLVGEGRYREESHDNVVALFA